MKRYFVNIIMALCCIFTCSKVSAQGHWAYNANDYQYGMTAYITLHASDAEISDLADFEVAAFVDDECRGVSIIETAEDGSSYVYLRIRSNKQTGEDIRFKVYSKRLNYEFTPDYVVSFANISVVGFPSEPIVLNLGRLYCDITTSITGQGEVLGAGKYNIGSEVTLIPIPAEGYHFEGWTDGTKDSLYVFTATFDKELTATFVPNKYKVTFMADNQIVFEEYLDYGSSVTVPTAPEKTGYSFSTWGNVDVTVPAHDVTYTAVYTINQYTITFDTDGGSEVAAITQDYATAVTAPAAPTKTGYTFKGWDKEIPATIPAENVTIKAQWEINQYTITFETDGGSEVAAITQDYASAVTAPADPTKTGYTFKGWDKEIPATIPAEDITIKALWTINQYTITFDTDGGSEIAPITQDYNSAVTAPADPTKTGYTFAGWDKEIPTTIPAEDITIKALWTINQYKVTFIADGVIVSEGMYDYGTQIVVPEAPEKEGYTFSTWGEIDATVPDHDVTYTASYDVNYYKLTYILDDEVYAELDIAFGEFIVPIEVEPEEGRTFEGWQDVPETMPSHDVTIYGRYIATSINSTTIKNNEIVSVYTLKGSLVKKSVEFKSIHKTLESGVYIINGKKVLIK